jgi:Tfp pilus assembly PilM family ATPase
MNYLLGFELTGSNLKITALKKLNKNYQLFKLDKINLLDEGEKASEQLKEWVSRNLPNSEDVSAILALSESSLYLKELELPKVKNENIGEMIYWELGNLTPIPPGEAIYDWRVISSGSNTQKLLVMIAKNQYIENLLSFFRNAGIKIVAIEPSSVAFTRSSKADFSRTTLLSVVRESETDYVVLKTGVPVFATSTSVTLRGARRKLGKKVTQDLAADAKKILDYWEAREEQKIEQVLITGDLAFKYFGLALAINRFAKIPVGVARNKAFKNITISAFPHITLAKYLVPFGAAVRLTQKNIYEGINLFPKKELEALNKHLAEKRLFTKLTTFSYINIAVLAIFLITFFSFKISQVQLNKKVQQAKQFVANHPANEYLKEVNDANTISQNVIGLSDNQKDEGEKLARISNLTVQNLTFTSVVLNVTDKEEWKIDGIGDRADILALYEKLEAESGASEVTMPYSNLDKASANEFSIIIKW